MGETAAPVLLLAGLAGTAELHGRFEAPAVVAVRERIVAGAAAALPLDGGQVEAAVGDDLLVRYRSPELALRAAMRLMQASRDWCPLLDGVLPGLRIALHQGGAEATARLAALARQGEMVMSESFWLAMRANLPVGCTVLPLSVPGRGIGETVYRVDVAPEILAAASAVIGLRIVYGAQEWLVGPAFGRLTLGRDQGNDLVIVNRRASRQHGLVEYAGNRFYYTDQSSNGSFVSAGGGQEYMLHHDRAELRGKGRIYFGTSGNDPRADYLDFELL